LRGLQLDLGLDAQTKFVVQNINYNFHLGSNLTTATKVKRLVWSKQHQKKVGNSCFKHLEAFSGLLNNINPNLFLILGYSRLVR
jgi:hypothetical protein